MLWQMINAKIKFDIWITFKYIFAEIETNKSSLLFIVWESLQLSLALIMLSFSHLLKFILCDSSLLIFSQTQPGFSQDTIWGCIDLLSTNLKPNIYSLNMSWYWSFINICNLIYNMIYINKKQDILELCNEKIRTDKHKPYQTPAAMLYRITSILYIQHYYHHVG